MMDRLKEYTIAATVVNLLLLLFVCGNVHAATIPDRRAVNAIIGEAEGEGYDGMVAVACAIRNRGTLKGVYGEKAPRVVGRKYSKTVYNLAVKAWAASAKKDITNGATHWEGTKFRIPYWAKHMQVTLVVNHQRFYR